MGRAHSNAFLQAPRFFNLPYQPVLKAMCARNPDRAKTLRGELGLRVGRERLAHAGRAARHRSHRHRQPERHPRRNRGRRRARGQDGAVRETARPERRRSEAHGRGGRIGRRAEHGLVQLPARAGGHADQVAGRQRLARPCVSLSREVPAGLDDLDRSAAGRRRVMAPGCVGRRKRRDGRPARALHRHGDVAERARSPKSRR